jgi:Tfp pilus assembly protein PilO
VTAPGKSTLRCWHIDALGLLACALLTGVAYVAIVAPVLQKHSERSALRDELAEKRDRISALAQMERQLGGQVAELREELALSEVRLQPPQYLNTRMALIVELASAIGIVINETRAGGVKPGERYQTVPIFISGSGSYSKSAAFIHVLRGRLPDTGVVGFELSGNPGKPEATGKFRFELIWYAAPARADASQ